MEGKTKSRYKGEALIDPTFVTKNHDRILGANIKFQKGNVIFIPNLNLDIRTLTSYSEEEDEMLWTKEGLQLGRSLLQSFIEIDSEIKKVEDKTPKPEWVGIKDCELKDSLATKAIIKANQEEIAKRQQENTELFKVLDEQDRLKDLLFETGKPLESAVTKALHILGYQAENYDDGTLELDQVITSPEGQRFIGECEGKDSRDIDVSKFRQLLDSLNEDFEREDVDEKAFGLLLGNPQRLMAPPERAIGFTSKCIAGAKREKIGLIRTSDLFTVCKHIIENGDLKYAFACRKAILNQLGAIIKFPKITK